MVVAWQTHFDRWVARKAYKGNAYNFFIIFLLTITWDSGHSIPSLPPVCAYKVVHSPQPSWKFSFGQHNEIHWPFFVYWMEMRTLRTEELLLSNKLYRYKITWLTNRSISVWLLTKRIGLSKERNFRPSGWKAPPLFHSWQMLSLFRL
jgi:hypothetical protein